MPILKRSMGKSGRAGMDRTMKIHKGKRNPTIKEEWLNWNNLLLRREV